MSEILTPTSTGTFDATPSRTRPRPDELPELFDDAVERVSDNIYVVSPDEYNQLITLSEDDASELPDGLYVIDQTVRKRLGEAGITYDALNRSVLSGVGSAGVSDMTRDQLKLGRRSSAHSVFAGGLRMDDDSSGDTKTALIMIKTHVERANSVAKPFQELGKLAALQALDLPGIYRPLGLVQAEGLRFVMTELRPGIRTLDDHQWLGKKNRPTSPEDLAMMHERDTILIGRVFDLLGTLHAQGIFHGDAQAKNIGQTIQLQHTESTTQESDGIQMTVVDLENATIFEPQAGDLPRSYYEQLTDLAVKDLTQFFGSLPIRVRVSLDGWGNKNRENEDGFLMTNFVQPYIRAFARKRIELFGLAPESDSTTENLESAVLLQLKKLNNVGQKKDQSG